MFHYWLTILCMQWGMYCWRKISFAALWDREECGKTMPFTVARCRAQSDKHFAPLPTRSKRLIIRMLTRLRKQQWIYMNEVTSRLLTSNHSATRIAWGVSLMKYTCNTSEPFWDNWELLCQCTRQKSVPLPEWMQHSHINWHNRSILKGGHDVCTWLESLKDIPVRV